MCIWECVWANVCQTQNRYEMEKKCYMIEYGDCGYDICQWFITTKRNHSFSFSHTQNTTHPIYYVLNINHSLLIVWPISLMNWIFDYFCLALKNVCVCVFFRTYTFTHCVYSICLCLTFNLFRVSYASPVLFCSVLLYDERPFFSFAGHLVVRF